MNICNEYFLPAVFLSKSAFGEGQQENGIGDE